VSETVKVLIADDERLFVEALEAILGTEQAIEVAGRAFDGEDAARLAEELRPRVVRMDLSMPILDGFEATRRILQTVPETAVVVLTGSAYHGDVERAYEAGATGYVTKDRIAEDLTGVVIAAAGGSQSLS
jgi:DNA-binding NarL/FixJ family response regulator